MLFRSLCEGFRVLDEDNTILYRRHHRKVKFDSFLIEGAKNMKIQPDEGRNFIALPARIY